MKLVPFHRNRSLVTEPATRAEALAEHKKSIRRRIRYTSAVLIAGTGGFFGIHAASAYWTASGAGTGSATTGTMAVSVSATTGTPGTPLLPGGTGDVSLKVNNPNGFAVTLTAVTGNGSITAAGGAGSCTTTGVTFSAQTGLSQNIPGNSTDVDVDLPGAASMNATSQTGCQGATFTIPVTIAVQK
jgi:hypothetical protein